MRSMLVIGLGRFGGHLARKLSDLGNEVMVVDMDEEAVEKLAPHVTWAQVGDCMDVDTLRSLGVSNFDICFVCISNNFQSSLEITSLLKDLGAPCVISKTDRDIHAKFLRKIGADDVVYPERDMAQRTAVRYSAHNAYDYIELTSEYAIFELRVPSAWVGKTIRRGRCARASQHQHHWLQGGREDYPHHRPRPRLHRAGAPAGGRRQKGFAASDGR